MNVTYLFVFVVQHVREDPGGGEAIKFIGVYSSQARAQEAVDRLRQVEGFRDYPDGFSINRHVVDQDNWAEGFVTL